MLAAVRPCPSGALTCGNELKADELTTFFVENGPAEELGSVGSRAVVEVHVAGDSQRDAIAFALDELCE